MDPLDRLLSDIEASPPPDLRAQMLALQDITDAQLRMRAPEFADITVNLGYSVACALRDEAEAALAVRARARKCE